MPELTQKMHWAIGFLFVVVFLATGAYMRMGFPELYAGREEVRMMYRSTHIYILFGASVNLLVGHGLHRFDNYLRHVQRLASLILLLAPFWIVVGFFVESPSYLIHRPFSTWGVVSIFVGVLLVSVLNLPWARKQAG